MNGMRVVARVGKSLAEVTAKQGALRFESSGDQQFFAARAVLADFDAAGRPRPSQAFPSAASRAMA